MSHWQKAKQELSGNNAEQHLKQEAEQRKLYAVAAKQFLEAMHNAGNPGATVLRHQQKIGWEKVTPYGKIEVTFDGNWYYKELDLRLGESNLERFYNALAWVLKKHNVPLPN